MESNDSPERGGARATVQEFLKRDLPEASELSWLCQTHKDPKAMKLVLRSRYVCTLCSREGPSPR